MSADQGKLTVVVLTKDESMHITRCLWSVRDIADSIFVVDSGSTDDTIEKAKAAGAVVMSNGWVNHATQFNWALDQLPDDTQWVLRLDADEYLERGLVAQISRDLADVEKDVCGILLPRRIVFLGRAIRYGGLFPVSVLRLFRFGKGRSENRWMDEHIVVDGQVQQFSDGEIIDDNLNTLTWWIEKHNSYASREVVDQLSRKYDLPHVDRDENLRTGQKAATKRWLKEKVYMRVPSGSRALLYFLYRFVVRLGFLDGRQGIIFHVLQGFWYRYLVDAKLYEVRQYMRKNSSDVVTAIHVVLDIRLDR